MAVVWLVWWWYNWCGGGYCGDGIMMWRGSGMAGLVVIVVWLL